MRLLQIMALTTLMTFATVTPGFCDIKFMGASQLLKNCTANKNDPAFYEYEAACTAYVIGVADAFSCDDSIFRFSWRPPAKVTREQVVKVVVKWLNDHPEDLHFSAASIVARALQNGFPCN
jgi:Rap1a immunity proteins